MPQSLKNHLLESITAKLILLEMVNNYCAQHVLATIHDWRSPELAERVFNIIFYTSSETESM